MTEHLRNMSHTLREYFPEPNPNDRWIRNPFSCPDIEKISSLSEEEQDQLVDLSSNGSMKPTFNDKKIIHFWLTACPDHQQLARKALEHRFYSAPHTVVSKHCPLSVF